MTHPQQIFFIENVAKHLPEYFAQKKVIEFGSLNINGTVRIFFKDCDYIGIDIAAGKDVDFIARGEDFDSKANSYDVVISSEMFEHNAQWGKCFLNMIRILKEDGLMIFTCASLGRRQHGTAKFQPQFSPLTAAEGQDYYKNLTQNDFESIVNLSSFFEVFAFFEDRTFSDLYFFGLAKKCSPEIANLGRKIISAFNEHYYKKNVLGEY